MSERRFLGNVEVHSGTLVVGDPALLLPRAGQARAGADDEAAPAARRPIRPLADLPVLLQPDLGQGSFPVYGEFEGGQLVALTVGLQAPEVEDSRPVLPADLELPLRLSGAIWGHLVGDAVGVPYEFKSAASIKDVRFGAKGGTHDQPPGTWSDDGALMLALLDSLLEKGFDTDDQGRRAVAWIRRGAYAPGRLVFDSGNATRAALGRIQRGVPAEQAGGTDERSGGNGSLMRVLPLALVDRSVDRPTLVDRAHRASKVTHGHPRPQVACALYVLAARALLDGADHRRRALAEAADWLASHYREAGDRDRARALEHLLAYAERGGRGRAWDSFWSAWDAFAGAASYREAIERAVRYGNDTDTTAAIAGGLAGIWWGLPGIPPEWLAGMRGHTIAQPLIDRLLEREGWSTSTGNPIRVAWVPATETAGSGRLGVTFLPGKRDAQGGHGRRHWRTLGLDRDALAEEGVDRLLVLVEDAELAQLGVPDIAERFEAAGNPTLIRYPIPDVRVPADAADFADRVAGPVIGWLNAGESVVVACRGGLGRSGLVAACLLVDLGVEPDEAIARVRAARPGAIETSDQERFVRAHAKRPRVAR